MGLHLTDRIILNRSGVYMTVLSVRSGTASVPYKVRNVKGSGRSKGFTRSAMLQFDDGSKYHMEFNTTCSKKEMVILLKKMTAEIELDLI